MVDVVVSVFVCVVDIFVVLLVVGCVVSNCVVLVDCWFVVVKLCVVSGIVKEFKFKNK